MNSARLRLATLAACAKVLLCSGPAFAQAPVLEAAPAGVEAASLWRRAAGAFVAGRTYLEAVLSVREHARAEPREVVFRAWYDARGGRVFLRVLSPPAEAGTGILRLPPVVWRYSPYGPPIESLTPVLLGKPWLGSDFPLADLLDPPASIEAAGARLLGVDPAPGGEAAGRAYVLELRTRGSADGGRVLAWVAADGATPLRCEWRNAEDALLASLRFDAVREVAGRAVPHRWTLTRPDAPERESRIELREIRFDPEFDDAIFTTSQLVQRGSAPAAGGASDARLGAPGGSSP